MAKHRIPRGAIILLVIICMLLASFGGFGFYTATKIERMQSTNAQQQKTITQLQSSLAALEKTNGSSSTEMDKLQAENDRLKTENAEQKAENDQLKTENAEQKETIDKQQNTIDDLKVQIALKNTEPGDPNLPTMGEMSTYEGQKIVALTFDDGPGPYTERLLDELKARKARATFFVLGTRVSSYPKLIRRMAAEGHVVGNHSNAHNMLNRMDLVGVRNEMGKCAEKIEKLLGYRPCVMRCPGGNSSDTVKQYAKEAGVPIINWGVDTRDWESRNKEAILKVAKANIKDGSIVLLHDIHKVSVDATIELMDWLIEEGYTLVTVPELLYARRGGMEAGKTYY